VCGEQVFFYQSPSGGRVFFDHLGPPWPKHPCTDGLLSLPAFSRVEPREAELGHSPWVAEGWLPFRCTEAHFLDADRLYIAGIINVATRPPRNFDMTLADLSAEERAYFQASHQWPNELPWFAKLNDGENATLDVSATTVDGQSRLLMLRMSIRLPPERRDLYRDAFAAM
jgi:hypothetical protein